MSVNGKCSIDEFTIIREIERIVEEASRQESNEFGYTIWSHHVLVVVKFSKMLASILGGDEKVVEIAALLHDYANILNMKKYYKEHHIHGARMAEEILRKFKYPQEKIELVKKCIFSHRGSVVIEKTTNEELCVSSADAMAHIDQVFSLFLYRQFKNEKNGKDTKETLSWVRDKIERSWKKICPQGKEIIRERYESSINVINFFLNSK